jgi:hypothetical protein
MEECSSNTSRVAVFFSPQEKATYRYRCVCNVLTRGPVLTSYVPVKFAKQIQVERNGHESKLSSRSCCYITIALHFLNAGLGDKQVTKRMYVMGADTNRSIDIYYVQSFITYNRINVLRDDIQPLKSTYRTGHKE